MKRMESPLSLNYPVYYTKIRKVSIMIQDIRPHHYENSFAAKRVPCSQDFVLVFQDRQVLVGTKEKEEGSLIFPTVEEFCENDTC